MVIKSDKPIYALVEKHLRLNPQPVTCSALMEIDEIRTEALRAFGGEDRDVVVATRKMSNMLGFMWRRGILTRYPTPTTDTSFARFSYAMTEVKEAPVKPIPPARPRSVPPPKLPLTVKECEGGVEIELANFIIIVKQK